MIGAVRDTVHAFYSGHSLSDGVPEAVASIAVTRGQTFEFEFQTAGYSLLRERTKGAVSSPTWDGYRTGLNRNGVGLDVTAELASPSRLSPGARYDAVVVTERHDLPWVAATEGTATYLADFARRAWEGNPSADVFFYHTWLALDVSNPMPWVQYERRALRLWECVASRANRDLAHFSRRIHVLPGGAALAELTERLWTERVPGIDIDDPEDRVRLLFSDDVHLSPIGKYYMGLVHYTVLFGQAPSGTRMTGVSREASVFFEETANSVVAAYAPLADAAAQRDMDACRHFAATEMCEAAYRLPARGWRTWLMGPYRAWRCARVYTDSANPSNPFGDQ